jgi:hypothetical protein
VPYSWLNLWEPSHATMSVEVNVPAGASEASSIGRLMDETNPRAKRHSDYVQIVPLRTSSPEHSVPSLQTFAAEELQANLSEPEPDGYIRISKAQAEELLPVIDDYLARWGPLDELDKTLVMELRELLDDWE